MSSTELERSGEQSQALALKAIPVPTFLQELGVRFAYDEATNARLVMFPESVRQHVNVIDPVSSLVQADPNWTPRISIAHLNPDAKNGPHFYEQKGGKVAPTKQALEVLAKAAGILYTRTSRISRDLLDDEEPWAYTATVGVRRSDGTVEEITRERSAGDDANDKAHGREKTESKAVLRAIRAALQIPHTFTPAEAAKPFLVVGFNFTPDYNDAEVKAALIASGLNAQASFYGTDRPALAGGETSTDHPTVDEGQQAPAAQQPSPGAAGVPGSTEPAATTSETEQRGYNPPAGVADDPKVIAANMAAGLVPPTGVHAEAGRTLDEIASLGPDGRRWFGSALRKTDWPGTFTQALWAYARVYLPELVEQVEGEQGTIL